jgi:hypothetical protein
VVSKRIKELLGGWSTAETCIQDCEVLVNILKEANEALVRVGGVTKCGEANPPRGVNAKQMYEGVLISP